MRKDDALSDGFREVLGVVREQPVGLFRSRRKGSFKRGSRKVDGSRIRRRYTQNRDRPTPSFENRASATMDCKKYVA